MDVGAVERNAISVRQRNHLPFPWSAFARRRQGQSFGRSVAAGSRPQRVRAISWKSEESVGDSQRNGILTGSAGSTSRSVREVQATSIWCLFTSLARTAPELPQDLIDGD